MEDHYPITELVAVMALQIGVIIFAVKLFGRLAKKIGISAVLGELIAGIVIGPFALGGIPLPGLPYGVFPIASGSLAVSNELYAFASIASIVLLFATGLETDIPLFLRYSVAGGIVGLGGAVASFAVGCFGGSFLLGVSFMDPRCLLLGVLCTATSLGITARILSEQKKMDSPEGVTIVAAGVFDDVLCVIILAIVMGVVAVMGGSGEEGLQTAQILKIAGRAFGIWLGFTALALAFSKKIAGFLKLFKKTSDFSILGLGIALILAGVFEHQGLAMIIGAYIAGLAISKSDIAPAVQERIEVLYELVVPVFFAVMGMLVNVREIISAPVLVFGAAYTGFAILAKIIGCGVPSLLLGFNLKGALRIGLGMVPRGEMALIVAGVGLAVGILDQQLFGVAVMMTLITTLAGPPFLTLALKIKGIGTRKPTKNDDSAFMKWNFSTRKIANIVISEMLKNLRSEGFYIQTMNLDEGVSKARKDDTVIFIIEEENNVTIQTAQADMSFVKALIHEAVVELYESVRILKKSSDPQAMKVDIMNINGRMNYELISHIRPKHISVGIRGNTKEEIITELVDMLDNQGELLNRDMVLEDVFNHEKAMGGSGMDHNIALPHAKSDGVDHFVVAVGIKKEGADFHSTDGEKSKIIIFCVSPKKIRTPHLQFIATIGAVLLDNATHAAVLNADSPEEVAEILYQRAKEKH